MGIQGLWDVIGEGSVESIASLSADHVQKAGRPFRIAIDEAGWRFHNLDDHKIAEIRKQEPRANPKEKAIFHRVISLLQLHVEVIFIFDGPKRPWEHGRPSGGFKPERIALLSKTLDALKVPHHRAPGEAEAECAKLQQEGIVDAVWSEDGDTLIFGCDYLLRTYRDGGRSDAKSKTHVRVHHAKEIKQRTGLDPQGLVLFAMLSGGDYCNGVKGCGARTAARAARQGFGADLCNARGPFAINACRSRIQDFLQRQAGTTAVLPLDFPNERALKNYRQPFISSSSELQMFSAKPNHQWGRVIDEEKLATFAAETFNVSGPLYDKHIDPIVFVRCIAHAMPHNRESNRCWGVRIVKSRKKTEDSAIVSATTKVKIQSRTAQLGGPCGDNKPVECEVLTTLLERGLPGDVLDGSTSSPRKRTRKSEEHVVTGSASTVYNRSASTHETRSREDRSWLEADHDDHAVPETQTSQPAGSKRKRSANTHSSSQSLKRQRTTNDITANLLAGLPATKYSAGRKPRKSATEGRSKEQSTPATSSDHPTATPATASSPHAQSLFVSPRSKDTSWSSSLKAARAFIDIDEEDDDYDSDLPDINQLIKGPSKKHNAQPTQITPSPPSFSSRSQDPRSSKTSHHPWSDADGGNSSGYSAMHTLPSALENTDPSHLEMYAIDQINDSQLQAAMAASLHESSSAPLLGPAQGRSRLSLMGEDEDEDAELQAVATASLRETKKPSRGRNSEPSIAHEVIDLCDD